MNTLYQKVKEISIFSAAFETVPNEIIQIQQDCDTVLRHKKLVRAVKDEFEGRNPQNIFRKATPSSPHFFNSEKLSTIEKMEAMHKEDSIPSEASSFTNSNYDFELGTTEGKNIWRTHLTDEHSPAAMEDRFKRCPRQGFSNNISHIAREECDQYQDVDIVFEEDTRVAKAMNEKHRINQISSMCHFRDDREKFHKSNDR